MNAITRLLYTSLALLVSGLLPTPAAASTIAYRTDAQLIAGSARVVHARVIGKRATRGGPNQSIYTVTTLQVIEDFTGVAGEIVETWELGGVLDGEFLYVGGATEYQVGQEVVVCLERGPLGYRSVAMSFSKFDVVSPTAPLRRSVGTASVVGGALTQRERSLAEFRALVQQTTGRAPVAGAAVAAAPVTTVADPFTLLGDVPGGTGPWRWPVVDAGTPITWFKNTTAAPPLTNGDAVSEILAALSAWTTPSTARITLQYGGTTTQAAAKGPFVGLPFESSGVISFEDPANEISGFTIAIGGGSGFLGSGGTVNGRTFNEFTIGFVIFQNAADLAALDPELLEPLNFARVLEHEVGHAIGLGHSTVDPAIMFPFCCDSITPVPPALDPDDIAGVTFIYPMPAPPACTYSLSASSSQAPATAGGGSLTVTTEPGCTWTAVSNSPTFLAITLGGGGTGPGMVTYGLNANTSSTPRSGTLTIANQVFIVYQEANPTAPCVFALNPTSMTVGAGATGGAVTVTAREDCPWTAASNSPFLAITHGAAGTGTDAVVFTATANGAFTRNGQLTIAGHTFTVTQLGAGASVALDKTSLNFAATLSGPTVIAQTSAQTIRLSQSAGPAVSWTLSSNQPWLAVSPMSGTGDRELTISVNPTALGVPAQLVGQITVNLTGAANTVGPITVNLQTYHHGTTVNPIGLIDTPLDNTTGVTGSIPFTGWALDDIEVANVFICRNNVAGEPAPVDPNCGGNAQIFVGTGVFIDGSRTDVQAAAPAYPVSHRAGWGFMVLTNMLPNQGNGTYVFHAYAVDREGLVRVLGTRTLVVDNANATVPFGTIDTPGQGDTVSGNQFINFGWALTQQPKFIPNDGSTISVWVDGALLGNADYGHPRGDIQALFPGYANTNTAVGFRIIDTTLLTNGLHTIVWNATDSGGFTGGLGSRFFRVANSSSSLTAGNARLVGITAAEVARLPQGAAPLAVKRGWAETAPWRSFAATSGAPVVRGEELDRFEFELEGVAGDTYAGFLRVGGQLAPLPVGSTLQGRTFTWSPGLSFIGVYDFVFVRLHANMPVSRQEARVVLHAKGSGYTGPQVVIDMPTSQQQLDGSFLIAGWAIDLGAGIGTGIDFLHVWAYPAGSDSAFFLGTTAYGGRRPDVAAVHGDQFADSGFGLAVNGLAPGTYDLAVFGWSSVSGDYVPARLVRVTVK